MAPARLPEDFAAQVAAARRAHALPQHLRPAVKAFGDRAMALLFPHFYSEGSGDPTLEGVEADAAALAVSLQRLLSSIESCAEVPHDEVPARFLAALPAVHAVLRSDAEAIFHGDPAARSLDEVILTYPGFHAIALHRVAHALHLMGVPLVPRLLGEYAHSETGVDIHPGAQIGRRFFIDHGTGVVIGETAVIGNGVKLYQGVTLGALVVEKSLGRQKRHPTLEDDVVVYSNATILGGDTVIGHDSVIGGNAWITHSVPPFSIVSHESEVKPQKTRRPDDVDFHI
jgi:serine O-acetyltransferase